MSDDPRARLLATVTAFAGRPMTPDNLATLGRAVAGMIKPGLNIPAERPTDDGFWWIVYNGGEPEPALRADGCWVLIGGFPPPDDDAIEVLAPCMMPPGFW